MDLSRDPHVAGPYERRTPPAPSRWVCTPTSRSRSGARGRTPQTREMPHISANVQLHIRFTATSWIGVGPVFVFSWVSAYGDFTHHLSLLGSADFCWFIRTRHNEVSQARVLEFGQNSSSPHIVPRERRLSGFGREEPSVQARFHILFYRLCTSGTKSSPLFLKSP